MNIEAYDLLHYYNCSVPDFYPFSKESSRVFYIVKKDGVPSRIAATLETAYFCSFFKYQLIPFWFIYTIDISNLADRLLNEQVCEEEILWIKRIYSC